MSRKANTVPVYSSLLSDPLTPVSAFERLAGDSDHAFLLESVVGGEKIARYSFLGVDPIATLEAIGARTIVATPVSRQEHINVDPLTLLESVLDRYLSRSGQAP